MNVQNTFLSFFTYLLKYVDVHSIVFDMKTNLEMVY